MNKEDLLTFFNLFEARSQFGSHEKSNRSYFSFILILGYLALIVIHIGAKYYNLPLDNTIILKDRVLLDDKIISQHKNVSVSVLTEEELPAGCAIMGTMDEGGKSKSVIFKKKDKENTDHYFFYELDAQEDLNESNNQKPKSKSNLYHYHLDMLLICSGGVKDFKANLYLAVNKENDYSLDLYNRSVPFSVKKFSNDSVLSLLESNQKSWAWNVEMKLTGVIDDDSYFGLSLEQEEINEKVISGQFLMKPSIHAKHQISMPSKVLDDKVYRFELGQLNIKTSEFLDLSVRRYLKIYNYLPLYILLFLIMYLVFKIFFFLYDSNSSYLCLVNSFFEFKSLSPNLQEEAKEESYDDEYEEEEESGEEDSEAAIEVEPNKEKLIENGNNDEPSTLHMPIIESSFLVNSQISHGIEQKQKINEYSKYGPKLIASFFNENSQGMIPENSMRKSSCLHSINDDSTEASTIRKESGDSQEKNKQLSPKDISISQTQQPIEYQKFSYSSFDIFLFIFSCCSKKIALKRRIFQMCRSELNYYLNPHYYLKICTLNHKNINRELENEAFYTVKIDDKFKEFQTENKLGSDVCSDEKSNNFVKLEATNNLTLLNSFQNEYAQ